MFTGILATLFPWLAVGLLVGIVCGIIYRRR